MPTASTVNNRSQLLYWLVLLNTSDYFTKLARIANPVVATVDNKFGQ